MSYEIIRSLHIDTKNNKIMVKAASSNVFPKDFSTWEELNGLSALLKKEGKEAVIKEILYLYFSGCFQQGNNNFNKSLILLDRNEYNWDTVGIDVDGNPKKYSVEEVKEVLYDNYLKFKNRKKGTFVIVAEENRYFNKYLIKATKNSFYYKNLDKKENINICSNIKKFNSKEEAEFYIKKYNLDYYNFKTKEIKG